MAICISDTCAAVYKADPITIDTSLWRLYDGQFSYCGPDQTKPTLVKSFINDINASCVYYDKDGNTYEDIF